MPFRSARMLVPLQGAVAIVGLVGLTLWPPANGRLLLVPLAGDDASAVAAMALGGGAVLLGPGPLPGSLVVLGERARVAQQLPRWTVAMMAAPPAGCGTTA